MENTKKIIEAELMEQFGFHDETGFRNALAAGEIEKAKAWLKVVIEIKNRSKTPLWYCQEWIDDRYEELNDDNTG